MRCALRTHHLRGKTDDLAICNDALACCAVTNYTQSGDPAQITMKQQAFRFVASPPACRGFATSQGTTLNAYDIAIVGAGLTGAALAAGLGKTVCLAPAGLAQQEFHRPMFTWTFATGSNPLTAKLKVALLDRQVLSTSTACTLCQKALCSPTGHTCTLHAGSSRRQLPCQWYSCKQSQHTHTCQCKVS